MQLHIQKSQLAEIYSGMAKLLSQGNRCVQIACTPGCLRAVGTNSYETLIYEQESTENEKGVLTLPLEQLKEIVGAYGNDTPITFTSEEETICAEWETNGLVSSHTFQTETGDLEIKTPDDKNFKPLDRDRFRAEYLFCAECTTQERARFALDHIVLDGEKSRMLATDGRQMYEAKSIEFPWDECSFLPTGKSFPEKLLLSNGNLEVARTDQVLAFRNGTWTYLVKAGEVSFPPVEKLAPDIGDTEVFLIVSEVDSKRLIDLLPHLPGKEHRSSLVTLKAENEITFHGESKEVDSKAEGSFTLSSSQWIGDTFEINFSREFVIRALKNGFRTFRFLPGNSPIVSETETGKYLFMPMTIREEDEESEDSEHETRSPKLTPAQTRKRRVEWLKREALWLSSELAEDLGYITPSGSPSKTSQVTLQLERVLERLSGLSDKRSKNFTLEQLLPPSDEPAWEDIGDFARADGTVVTLVRSNDGFFSIRSEEGVDLTAEDVSGILEPLLSHNWKPCWLALYYNGQLWWIDAEHSISRKGKKAERRLIVGEPRPASGVYLEWEINILKRLVTEYGEPLPTKAQDKAHKRLEKLECWSQQPAPQVIDLIPLCLQLPATV